MEKQFTMRELLKRGFIRLEDEDFRDDGNKFKVYYYKGLRITYLKSYGEYYLSIDLPYGDYIYDDYKNKPWYKLTDEFNGCDNVDPDKVIENCEAIIKGLKELQDEITKEEKADLDLLYLVKAQEIEMAEKVLNDFKSGNYIWNISGKYELEWAIDAVKSLEKEVLRLKDKEFYNLPLRELRTLNNQLEKHNYLYIKEDNYYIKKLKKIMEEDI